MSGHVPTNGPPFDPEVVPHVGGVGNLPRGGSGPPRCESAPARLGRARQNPSARVERVGTLPLGSGELMPIPGRGPLLACWAVAGCQDP